MLFIFTIYCLNKLFEILKFGKEAKCFVDFFIDQNDQVQNLRTAIYPLKQASDLTEKGIKARAYGVAYLSRYFYLILFSGFLLEKQEKKSDSGNGQASISFEAWLNTRSDVQELHENLQSFDFE